ncbi:MAG: flagellar biosynthetic protein FliR [Deltaproteobacteria bacterium]|nr:flagellar biosynthetic protein FliR [Deltaproteobacteria bacterium]MCB9488996.1 flagellar biosynthetic protein FliR [Deltaproteobacteria bacterium]
MWPAFPPDQLVVFFLIFFRILAVLMLLPVFSARTVYDPAKLGLAFFMAIVTTSFLQGHDAMPLANDVPMDFGGLVLAIAGEIFLGVTMGFVVTVAIDAINYAGNVAGFEMGLTVANAIDPSSGLQNSIISNFYVMFASMIFIVTGLYLKFVEGIVAGFLKVGPGQVIVSAGSLHSLVELGGTIFVGAVSIGAPWIIVLLLAKVSLGLMARTFPQMNVFFVGFPLTIGLGLFIFAVSLPFAYAAIYATLEGSLTPFWAAIKAAAPGS